MHCERAWKEALRPRAQTASRDRLPAARCCAPAGRGHRRLPRAPAEPGNSTAELLSLAPQFGGGGPRVASNAGPAARGRPRGPSKHFPARKCPGKPYLSDRGSRARIAEFAALVMPRTPVPGNAGGPARGPARDGKVAKFNAAHLNRSETNGASDRASEATAIGLSGVCISTKP